MKPHAWLCLCLLLSAQAAFAKDAAPEGGFSENECRTCHQQISLDLWAQWQKGAHGKIDCVSCHGDNHASALSKARADASCQSCHQGAASHSYATSKHGVINHLNTQQDWRQPLSRGNYRAPGCAYCHMHEGAHDDSMAKGLDLQIWVCAGCHSPRFVREQLENGQRQVQIASLKLKEGQDLAEAGSNPMELRPGLQKLKEHWHHVLLGQGHQSPDYQWWHGQPAMDGDLIFLKDKFTK